MKRFLVVIAVLAISLLTQSLAPASTHAVANPVQIAPNCGSGSANGTPDVCTDISNQPGNTDAGGNPTNQNPIIKIIKTAINILSFIVGIGAVIGIVVSGFRIITAGGDSQAVASARNGLIFSLAGLAVAVLAQALVALVLSGVG